MKKSLIALAVLAASSAAMAQSSVQVYGVIDLWVGSVKDGLGAKSVTKLDAGGVSTNRIGFKGTEDLGGGLKANFQIETKFVSDTPAASSLGDREAWVGVSGGFGEVRLGNTVTPFDDVSGALFANFDSAFSPEYGVFASVNFDARPKNTVKYITPSFAGFTGAVSYSLDESTAVKADTTAVSVSYANGPVAAVFGYQVEKDSTADDLKSTRIAGSYDFGIARAVVTYGQAKEGTDKATEYSIGADFPVTSSLTLSAAYAVSQDKVAGVKADKRDGFGLSASYSLSKRTSVYAGYTTNKQKLAGVKNDEFKLYAVGVRHAF